MRYRGEAPWELGERGGAVPLPKAVGGHACAVPLLSGASYHFTLFCLGIDGITSPGGTFGMKRRHARIPRNQRRTDNRHGRFNSTLRGLPHDRGSPYACRPVTGPSHRPRPARPRATPPPPKGRESSRLSRTRQRQWCIMRQCPKRRRGAHAPSVIALESPRGTIPGGAQSPDLVIRPTYAEPAVRDCLRRRPTSPAVLARRVQRDCTDWLRP